MGWKDRAIAVGGADEGSSGWKSRAVQVAAAPEGSLEDQVKEAGHGAHNVDLAGRGLPFGMTGHGVVQGALNALPAAGAMAGGVAGAIAGIPSVAGVPVAALGGAGLGMAGGEALKNLGEKYLLGQDKSREEIYGNPVKGLVEGPFYEMGGQIPEGALKALAGTAKGQALLKALTTGAKENAPEIMSAAERIGAKATPGMTSDSEVVRRTEDALSQKPTLAGHLVRRETEPVHKAVSDTVEGLLGDASPDSPFISGEKAKEQIGNAVEQKFAEPKRLFGDLQQYTKDIPSTENSTKAVSRNILNIPDVAVFEDGPAAGIARSVNKALENSPSADQLKDLRTMVGKKAAAIAGQGGDASGIWQIYAKLGKLEENTIKRGVISSARTAGEGDTIAQGMLGQLKSAKQGWSQGLNDLQDFSSANRMGAVKNPEMFVDKVNSMPSENIQEGLLPLDDVRRSQALQNLSPETHDLLRRARIRDLDQSTGGGAAKFLRATNKLSPEAQQMLFRDQAPKIGDLNMVTSNLPERTGPSGTPQGNSYFGVDSLNPIANARDMLQYAQYKGAANNVGGKFAESLKQSPVMSQMADRNPGAFHSMVTDISSRFSKPNEMSFPAAAGNESERGDQAHYDPADENRLQEGESKQRFLLGN